jgi:hypothetical protein
LEGSEEDEFGDRRELVVVGVQGKKKFSTAARGFILAALYWQRMRTSERGTAASSCVARRVAAPDAAALPRRQSTPPCSTL